MYAGVWKRVAAYLIDYLILNAVMYVVNVIIIFFLLRHGFSPKSALIIFFPPILFLAVFILYYGWMESSRWQATIGKRLLKLKVTNLNGERLSFARAAGRNAGKILSSLFLGLGFLNALWNPRKQCLHDILCDCVVLNANSHPTKEELNAQAEPPATNTPRWLIITGCILIPALIIAIAIGRAMPDISVKQELQQISSVAQLMQVAAQSQQMRAYWKDPYAPYWTWLEAWPAGAIESPSFCTAGPQPETPVNGYEGCGGADGWAVTLGENEVTAWRVNHMPYKYNLKLSYEPNSTITCQADTLSGMRVCEKINPK